MPSHRGRTARSSSRSSKRSEPPAATAARAVRSGTDAPAASLPGNPVAPDPTALAVGTIVGAHGLRGLVRVRAYQPPAPSIAASRELLVERGGAWRRFRLTDVTPHGAVLLVALGSVADRDTAEALRGARVMVAAADLPPPGPDEFYWHEVIGFAVDTVAGERLGTIVETMSTGLNDVWVVRDAGHEHLIPVIDDVVRTIDRSARRIVIAPLPGLLD